MPVAAAEAVEPWPLAAARLVLPAAPAVVSPVPVAGAAGALTGPASAELRPVGEVEVAAASFPEWGVAACADLTEPEALSWRCRLAHQPALRPRPKVLSSQLASAVLSAVAAGAAR